MRKESLIYTVLFVFAATFVFTGALSFVHTSTADIVADNERERYQRAVLAAMGIEPETQAEVFDEYETVERLEGGDAPMYRSTVDGREVIATPFTGPGVWGAIEGIISVTADGARIVGVEILDQNETPGLGGRVTEDWFLSQFDSEQIGADGEIALNRGSGDYNPDNSAIDGITGATGTSRSIHRIVNNALARLREALSQGT